eukprot:scaffold135609_cov33-Attheya_sp.AAC.4
MPCAVQTNHFIVPAYYNAALCLLIQYAVPTDSNSFYFNTGPRRTANMCLSRTVPIGITPAMPCTVMPCNPPAMLCCHDMATCLPCNAMPRHAIMPVRCLPKCLSAGCLSAACQNA